MDLPAMNGTDRNRGFSLVEIMIAITLIGTVLISLMALVGMGIKAAHDSTHRATLGHIYTDVHHRIQGAPMEDGPIPQSPIYYDEEGVYVPADADEELIRRRTYRVDVRLNTPAGKGQEGASGLKSVMVTVRLASRTPNWRDTFRWA